MKRSGAPLKRIATINCFTWIVLISPAALADIYSFKDDNGVTHYSSLPSLDKRYKLAYQIPAHAAQVTDNQQTAGSKELSDDMKKLLGIEKLPPVEKRKIIGTWFRSDRGCTLSFEQVGSKYYDVGRCGDGSGGKDGVQVLRANGTTFRPLSSTRSGDYYVIQKDGDLAVRDNDGLVETLPKQSDLWPRAKLARVPDAIVEGKLTKGLSCFDVGYRYGHTAMTSMKGRRVNPAWDFVVPNRCKDVAELRSGIAAGTRAAS